MPAFHEHQQADERPKTALDQTFARVLAVVSTSVSVAGGFSALAFSQFTFIGHLGAITAAVPGPCLPANTTLFGPAPTLPRRRSRFGFKRSPPMAEIPMR